MAQFVLSDAFCSVAGVDLSDHVKSLTLNHGADSVEKTVMSDTTHKFMGGLKVTSLDVEFAQDFASAKVDATLFPLVGTTAAIIVRPDSAAVSATNPNFTFTGLLESYPPLGGSIGDEATVSVTFQTTTDLSRATS